jgi:exopolyphosphatase / guanosine-5'-triphosphate,3'-diphosphate pyrophosphatase
MRRASIDLGTNTCLLLVADVSGEAGRRQIGEVYHDQSTMVRLGQEVDRTKRLHPDAVARTAACLRGYAAKMASLGVKPSDAVCVATATARDAENGAEFFTEVTRETGLVFRTISGDEEARDMFRGGLLPGMDVGRAAVLDIGGGSTEFKSESGGMSLNLGSVRFTERYLKSDPVTDEEFWAARDAIDEAVRAALKWRAGLPKETELVGVAGTVVSLAQCHLSLSAFDAKKIDGTELTRGDIHRLVEELKWRSVAERKEMSGIEPGRADVLLAGALILWRSMECLNFPKLRVSTRGLRYGVLLN